MIRVPFFLALTALVACGPGPADAAMVEHDGAARLSGSTMGTTWNAVVPGAADAALSVQAAVQEALDQVDDRMSTWNPNSELSRFNLGSDRVAAGMGRETIKVIREALRVAALSEGAFDPTVLPLVQLWGFGPDRPEGVPTGEDNEAALGHVGWRKVTAEGAWLQRESASVQLDLSGVAKGWGVDQAGGALSRLGWENWLVEVGGEIRTRGLGPGGLAWRVGLDLPVAGAAPGEAFQAILEPGSQGMATSGDYRNWREVDGRRLSHTLDPRTGRPVENALASATVLAPTCMTADALATAVCVLGAESGMELIESLDGVEAFLVIREGDGFREAASTGFPERIAP